MKKLLFLVLSIAVVIASMLALSSCKKSGTSDVIFMSNGKMYASIATAGNAVVPMPPEPTRDGFVFGGWFYDQDLWDQPYDNTKWEKIPLLGDVTVYAKWKPSTPCAVHTPREFTVLEEPTCAKAGTKQTVCRVCDEVYTEQIPSLAHTPVAAVVENVVDATCKNTGSYDEVVYCSVCSGEVSRTAHTVDKKAHTPADTFTVENFSDSTCTAVGSYDEVYACTQCDENALVTKKTVEKKPHSPQDAAKRENEIPSTCQTQGSYDMVIRCHSCNAVISSTSHTLPLADHTSSIPCKVCGIHDFLTYELVGEGNDAYYVVTGATMKNFTEIEIPAKYNGISVRKIAEGAFRDFDDLQKITIPGSIMTIEKNAFVGCSALTQLSYKGTKKEWGYITIAEEGNHPLINAKKDYESNRTEWMPFEKE